MFGVGTAFPHLLFQHYTPACQQQSLNKSSAQHEIRCFFINQHSAVSNIFFSTYCTVFLKLRYRNIVAFRTKIEWMRIGHWPTAKFAFPNIVRSFSMPLLCNKHLPRQSASIIISRFLVCLSLRLPQAFLGGRESCACFRNNMPFFRPSSYFLWSNDFDNNQQYCVSSSLWLIVCHWWAGIFVNKFRHFDLAIVMCKGVTRLDGALGKKRVWRLMFEPGLSEANVLFWKKCLWHCFDFLDPRNDSAPGELFPPPPRYVSGVMQ